MTALIWMLPCMAIFGLTSAPVLSRSPDDPVRARVVFAATTVAPGADLPASIEVSVAPQWHVWTQSGATVAGATTFDGAEWTSVEVSGVGGAVRAASAAAGTWITAPTSAFTPVLAQWPKSHLVTADVGDGPQKYAVFEGTFMIGVPLAIAPDAREGEYSFTLRLRYQACDATTCLAPTEIDMPITLRVAAGAAMPALDAALKDFDPSIFAALHGGGTGPRPIKFDFFGLAFSIDPKGAGFLLVLLIAALGGMLLNFTPCVLPVIPLKIMGLAHSAGNRRRCLLLGAMLSLGVIAFWVGLGVAVSLISGFTTSSQLFQYPWFTIGVGVVIAVMAIGMCGLFSLRLPQSLAGIDFRHDTFTGSFGFGIMTAVLSTPCTAPLMGAAAAWAATQQPWVVLLVFGVIGSGMALPYLLLSAFPQLVQRVPRSGPASDLVKQVMGLLLLAAAAYFIGAGAAGMLASPPEPPTNDYWWIVAALGIAAGGWMSVRTWKITPRMQPRLAFGSLGLGILIASAAVGIQLTDDGKIPWVYFTPERLADAQARGDAVVVDFTAEWCLNCKTLEKTILESDAVSARLSSAGVTPIKVDFTGDNPQGRALLKRFERLTIPLLVVISPSGEEVFKSDTYTPMQVLQAIDAARGQPPASAATTAATPPQN
jgi:thiol:disulfide interchange protein DsbD